MLAEKIKENRLRLGLTQEQLAAKLSVTKATVSKWETNQSCPDIAILPKLADLFLISMDELLDYRPAQSKPVEPPRYKTTVTETEFRYQELYLSKAIDKIDVLYFGKTGDKENGYQMKLEVNLDFRDPQVIREIQKRMPEDEYLDMVEMHADGSSFHLWVCKDEVLRFRTGCKSEIMVAAKRLMEKGILDEDDLY